MLRKLLRNSRLATGQTEQEFAIVAQRLEPRIMFSATPGTELLIDGDLITAGKNSEFDNAQYLGEVELGDEGAGFYESNASGPSVDSEVENQLDQLLLAFHDPAEVSELVVIDKSVTDYQQLLADLQNQNDENIYWLLIDSTEDGIAKMTEELARYSGLEALHVISHGSAGQVQLGNTILSSENLSTYADAISSWQDALDADGDILFYGCNLSASEGGRDFLNELSVLCECDVAASNDLTGTGSLGGDWDLEYVIGSVSTNVIFTGAVEDWYHVLETVEVTASADTYIDADQYAENYGSSTDLLVDSSGAFLGDQRSLVEFDLSFIPSGVTINSATLSLNATFISGDVNVGVYAILQDWEEGGADGGVDAASWTERTDTESWTTEGGLIDADLATVTNRNSTGEHTWDITGLVQDWIDGDLDNHGIMIASSDSDLGRVEYASRESGNGPKLVIDYTSELDLDIADEIALGVPQVEILEDANNDGFINLSENLGPIDYAVILPGDARVGEVMEVNGDSVILTETDLATGMVTGTLPAASHGEQVTISVILFDLAGHAREEARDFAVIDLVAPDPSSPLDLARQSDTGECNRDNYTGDLNPLLRLPAGTGSPGEVITIYSDGQIVGVGTVDSDGGAMVCVTINGFTVQKLTYTLTDLAGNEGKQSIGLCVEFYDNFLPYRPPANPEILGVEQINQPVNNDVVNPMFFLNNEKGHESEQVTTPYCCRFLIGENLNHEGELRLISTEVPDSEEIQINVRSAENFGSDLDELRISDVVGDLNYRVAAVHLDELAAYDKQIEDYLHQLNVLVEENREDYAGLDLLVGTASVGNSVVVAGIALWGIRTLLIASLFATSIPSFGRLDPLMILNRSGSDKETLAQIAQGNSD